MTAPEILTLEQWEGRNQGHELMRMPVTIIHVHHSVTNEEIGVRPTDDAISDLRELDALGQYGGISYSAAGHPEGVVGIGQGLQIGTHTLYWNGFSFDYAASFGYCFIGDFEPREANGYQADELTQAAIDGFRYWRDMMLFIGALAPDYVIRSHHEARGNSTACAGDNVDKRIPELYLPYATTVPEPEEVEMLKLEHPTGNYAYDATGKRGPISGAEDRALNDAGVKSVKIDDAQLGEIPDQPTGVVVEGGSVDTGAVAAAVADTLARRLAG